MTEPLVEFRRTTFGPRQRRIARAVAEALFTADEPLDPERLDRFVDDVDDHVSHTSFTLRFGLSRMLDVIGLLPPFLLGKLSSFEDLSVEKRVEMLEKMDRSSIAPLALMLVAFKTLMTMCWYEAPERLAALGYPGDLVRERWKRLPVAPTSEAAE
jgi:hypothetical protein